jgi:hypothetical protein
MTIIASISKLACTNIRNMHTSMHQYSKGYGKIMKAHCKQRQAHIMHILHIAIIQLCIRLSCPFIHHLKHFELQFSAYFFSARSRPTPRRGRASLAVACPLFPQCGRCPAAAAAQPVNGRASLSAAAARPPVHGVEDSDSRSRPPAAPSSTPPAPFPPPNSCTAPPQKNTAATHTFLPAGRQQAGL